MASNERYGGPGEKRLGDVLWAKRMKEAKARMARWRELRAMDAVCSHRGCFQAIGVNGRYCLPHFRTDGQTKVTGPKRLVLPPQRGSMWAERSW